MPAVTGWIISNQSLKHDFKRFLALTSLLTLNKVRGTPYNITDHRPHSGKWIDDFIVIPVLIYLKTLDKPETKFFLYIQYTPYVDLSFKYK